MLYAVIIALWICILLPMWLRRHDDALESRSADRFASAMRTLSGRGGQGTIDQREVVMPGRVREPVHVDGSTRAVADGRSLLAARRRRSLLLLVLVTAGVLGAGLAGWLPIWAAALPALLLVGFVVHLRRASKARVLLDRRRQAQQTTQQNRRRRAAALPTLAESVVEVEQILPAARVLEPALVGAALGHEPVAEEITEGFYDAEADRAWEPVPVPLPTYVLAPKAPRSVRVIDLTKPGLWTSGHLSPEEAERLVAEALDAPAADVPDVDDSPAVRHEPAGGEGIVTGEVVIERRRAVGD